jgi:hypothetical protein
MKPICVPCQRFFRMQKGGFPFTEGMPVSGTRPLSGKETPEQWKPYKLWYGDKWKCQGCGAEIIVGSGFQPVAIHHEDDFEADRINGGFNQFQVNDC